eukprot:1179784-Prorocentrum_minimum.AAC.3
MARKDLLLRLTASSLSACAALFLLNPSSLVRLHSNFSAPLSITALSRACPRLPLSDKRAPPSA